MGEAPGKNFVAQTSANPVAIKLNDDNFLPWKQQALFTIKGFKLRKHVEEDNGGKLDGYLTDEDKAKGKVSDESSNWEQQDQLLASWLLACFNVRESPHKNGGL